MSLGTTTRSLMKTAKSRFPGAADADLHQFVILQVGTALKRGTRGIKDDELISLADADFEAAVEAGEPWAVSLKNSYRDNVIKPLVDKARAAGVDPIPVVIVETGLAEADARSMIEALDTADEDDSSTDEEDEVDANGFAEPSVTYGGSAATAA